MKTVNPFSDPEFKKQILQSEGLDLGGNATTDDYEVLEPDAIDELEEMDRVISKAPKIPSQVKNVILDATAIAKNEKEQRALELNRSLNEVFTKYNKEYKTDLSIDFNSLSRTLVNVADPKSRRTLELYVSEIFQSMRPILILHMISKLTLAIDYVLDPTRLFGQDMTTQDIFIAVEKLLQYIEQLEGMKKDIIVSGASLELEKLAEANDGGGIGETEEQKKMIEDFMNIFKQDNGL